MKKLIILVASASIALFSCNKEEVVSSQTTESNNPVLTLSGTKDMEYRGPNKKCDGRGVDCIEYKEIVIQGVLPTYLSASGVQVYFTTGAGSTLLPSFSTTIQSKLTSGNYSMQINYSDPQTENYTFTNGSDIFALQFNVQ